MAVYMWKNLLRVFLSQTFGDFEFLIIDDGSTDNTREVLEIYRKRDPRILVHHQLHLGLVAALNKGIELARGKYIARMDADDISEPTRFAEQVVFLEEHPDVGVLGSQMDVINRNGTVLRQYEVPILHSMIAWNLLFDRSFAHPTVIMRRELLRFVGGYRDDLPTVEDLDLWLRLAWKTRFSNLDRQLVTYRTHSEATSVKHAKIQQMNVRIMRQRFISDLLGRPVPVEQVELLARSQKADSTLDEEQAVQSVSLLLELYDAFKTKGIVLPEEKDAVRIDYLKRTIRASQLNKDYRSQRPDRKNPLYPRFILR
jgi:glycosyltransferase involved in cell wall biosynthesis